ncbi:hypothetical protein [Sphingobium sp. DC-2]|uniref:DUF6894 family protein n=1 Tax=Sphingobium sp. DC-2 TaxID=1303256 RepID=UPI0004C45E73|nr:hypothetical protein [Sphingobium sp. DC-2]
MPRYFINIYNDADVLDDEGADHADLAAAKEVAIRGVRAMMAEHVSSGRPVNLRHRVEITDNSGKVLATIPFGELITIVD